MCIDGDKKKIERREEKQYYYGFNDQSLTTY